MSKADVSVLVDQLGAGVLKKKASRLIYRCLAGSRSVLLKHRYTLQLIRELFKILTLLSSGFLLNRSGMVAQGTVFFKSSPEDYNVSQI